MNGLTTHNSAGTLQNGHVTRLLALDL